MSRRCQSTSTLAKKQRRMAEAIEWQGFTADEKNLCVRRLAARAQIRKARRNAELIAKQATLGGGDPFNTAATVVEEAA